MIYTKPPLSIREQETPRPERQMDAIRKVKKWWGGKQMSDFTLLEHVFVMCSQPSYFYEA